MRHAAASRTTSSGSSTATIAQRATIGRADAGAVTRLGRRRRRPRAPHLLGGGVAARVDVVDPGSSARVSGYAAPPLGEVSERSKERDWKSRMCRKVRRGFKSLSLRLTKARLARAFACGGTRYDARARRSGRVAEGGALLRR